MSAVIGQSGHGGTVDTTGHDHVMEHEHHGAPHGWKRWVYATNHKDIGTMYLVFAFTMFMFGGILALGIRSELFPPGLQFFNPQLFNQLTTMHGLIMVFGAIMPAFVGFANWMVQLQIGAPDMASTRSRAATAWRTTTTTSTTARRTAGAAGSTRPTTRTSAQCTCCSRSRCSWWAGCLRSVSAPSSSTRACNLSTRSCSTS